MKRSMNLLFGSLLLTPVLHADVPVFRDQVLAIEEAVVFQQEEPVYYGDIRMQANEDGTFTLIRAERRSLALIDSADVLISNGNPLQVTVYVRGTLSVACAALQGPGVSRYGNVFNVVLAETTLPPDAVCMSLLAVTPFEIDIPLNKGELPPGNYVIHVNDKVVEFSL